ncbi:Methyltransferase domain-containing protein [Desulfonispora thiosulfatigenes DSM 11270]|uniref:Methyltransferase domain-containing protein n=1 Tax=Desulfonispora thiosulfatigenes DSM 11270 TaxID=656914 RepID=A0A1W1UEI4_DESTI|nr:methyltransferase domain-containing protein [Desulfonispora thiosulfatigenes]SMB79470.1 Methyltransferase domain-containing protein [Desulfonispora thiosulfatigenes DSM 11270]
MLNKVKLYLKGASKLYNKEIITSGDYAKEYDKVASTYNLWLAEMGKFTDKIIKPEYYNEEKRLKILDFACGTGYITKKLLEKEIDCEITAVDISAKMLEQFKEVVGSEVRIINQDGMKFLENTEEKFDLVFCGWALPYFNQKELIKQFKRVLYKKGLACVIVNSQGTLQGIEEIFLKVMEKNQQEVNKFMDIRFHLPKGTEGLEKWFKNQNFATVKISEEENNFAFDTPEELFEWLTKTGAIAGTAQIFQDFEKVKDDIIAEIKKKKYENGKYVINHKFASGIFQRS